MVRLRLRTASWLLSVASIRRDFFFSGEHSMMVHLRSLAVRLACVAAAATAAASVATASPVSDPHQPVVVPNDNRHPVGTLEEGTLKLSLRAGQGAWQPEGPAGPTLSIEAFGEGSSSLTVPAPLIRVQEGTRIVASVRNDLPNVLSVHGLCARDGSPCPTLEVPPGRDPGGPVHQRGRRHIPRLGVVLRRADPVS
jgi:FtsP/CotA-like multicopper oxidase with cupredoxin domain